MEFQPSWWAALSFSFLTTFLFFFFFILLLFLFLFGLWPWCNCHLCHTYLTSKWTTKFDNVSDWYAYLLSQSPTRTIHVHILRNTITANPQNVEHILKTNFDNYPKGKTFSFILGDLLGQGIFNVDGDSWRFQRKMASMELGSQSVRSYAFRIVSAEIQERLLPLLNSVADQDEGSSSSWLDLQDVFRRFAFDNVCKISFGVDPGCLELTLPVSDLAVAFDVATKLSAKRATLASPLLWRIKRFLNLGCERKLKEAIGQVDMLAEEVIRQRRKMGFLDKHDLLSRFMCSMDDEDDKFLRDIVISFILAGRDTIASALTSFFELLARNPDVERRISEEIALVVKRGEDAASLEELRGMDYLHAALYESMRLFPPVQFDSKFALEDDVLPDGTLVKKGTRVTYHPYAMGRMEDIWGADCLEFRPERWLDKGIFTPHCPFEYPVFQAGVRVCLGKEMAILEMKSVAAALISRFRIEISDSCCKPKFATGLTAGLIGGLRVRIRSKQLAI